jgi:hypothetical protein
MRSVSSVSSKSPWRNRTPSTRAVLPMFPAPKAEAEFAKQIKQIKQARPNEVDEYAMLLSDERGFGKISLPRSEEELFRYA